MSAVRGEQLSFDGNILFEEKNIYIILGGSS
jgi:hypothetical protein